MNGVAPLDRPVFVVGPPRSGTTLVQFVLGRHPDLHMVYESRFLSTWLDRYPALRSGDPEAFERFWEAFVAHERFSHLQVDADAVAARLGGAADARAVFAALLCDAAERAGKPRVGDKTPGHARYLGELLAWFPDARVVYTLRDPRAVVLSEMQVDRAWASDVPDVAARRWTEHVAPLAAIGSDPRVLVMRYEDLVADPRSGARLLLDHAELAWDPRVLEPDEPHVDHRHGTHSPWEPVSAHGIARWRDDLDPRTIAVIDAATTAARGIAGYGPAVWRLPPPRWPRYWAARARRAIGS